MILSRKVVGVSERGLEAFARRAQRALRLRGDVQVLVTGNSELRRLNRKFRRKDKATDVLSFPSARGLGGDIAISGEIAAANSRRFGHSLSEEIKVLMLHGLLHLARYDHETDNGAMARQELRLRRALSLPITLTERTSGRNVASKDSTRAAPRRMRKS